jgi:hypothetical protein
MEAQTVDKLIDSFVVERQGHCKVTLRTASRSR